MFELCEDCIKYRSGYKYQLTSTVSMKVNIATLKNIDSDFIKYYDGRLYVMKGYAWDGPSGPTLDTPDFMRASLFHDVFYQLIREFYITADYKYFADKMLKDVCKIDGMSLIRRSYVYFFVDKFSKLWLKYASKDKIITAP